MTVVIGAFHRLTIGALSAMDELAVEEATVSARLHAPWEAEVTFSLSGEQQVEPDVESLLGSDAEVAIGGVVHRGVIERVAIHQLGAVTVTVTPPVAQLIQSEDHRVFVNRAPLDVVDEVLGEHGITMQRRIEREPAARMQIVQAFESDLAFVGRLLAMDGIAWAFEDGTDSGIVAMDHPSAFAPIEGDDRLPYGSGDGLDQAEAVVAARLRHRIRPDVVALRDSWFETPALDLTVEAKRGPGRCPHYAFPGPNRFVEPDAGKTIADRWLDALTADGLVLEGVSTCPRLWPGRTFELADPPRADLAARWLVVAVESESHERSEDRERRYEARFVAVPADGGWRPPLPEAVQLGGVTTATVTGPAGEEIHCDSYGRVNAKLRWDRRGPDDDGSSAPIRPLHPMTTGGFFLPRVGWEVLVGFGGPSGDLPFVLGRLDNGGAPTAESLPAHKRRGNFGTPTSPGRGSANMLRMDDSAGNEEMRIVASSNYDEQTANNKATTIVADDVREVAGDQATTYAQNLGLKVLSPQSIDVAAKRAVTGGGGMAVQVASQSVSVGGVRDVTVGGHLSNDVGGSLTRLVGGAKVGMPILGHNQHVDGASIRTTSAHVAYGAVHAVSVAGASALAAGSTQFNVGAFTLKATGLGENSAARQETVGGNCVIESTSIDVRCGALSIGCDTVIKASASVTVTAGGCVLKVAPASVTLIGPLSATGTIHPTGSVKI